MISYVHALSAGFPTIVFSSTGDGTIYEDITWISGPPLPTKDELDISRLTITRENVWLAVQQERSRRQSGGVFIQSVNKWFHSDQTSRIQQLGLVMMGANIPANINWKTMDGSFVTMTQSLAVSIFNAAATLDMTAFGVAEQHRVNVMSSSTPGTYNYLSFWPAIFGE